MQDKELLSPEELYQRAVEVIRGGELSAYTDELVSRLDFSLDIQNEEATDKDIAIGAHKLGGSPDVAPDFAWPCWNEEPLTFIAQFDLSSLTPLDPKGLLPTQGLLSFFSMLRPMGFEPEDSMMHGVIGMEPETRGAWRVVLSTTTSSLERRVSPLQNTVSAYPSQRISNVWSRIGLPDTYEVIAPDGIWDPDDFWGDIFDDYLDVCDGIDMLCSHSCNHQLLGYARYRQNDMREDAARFGERNRKAMRLLAQFSSDGDRDLSFAGDGYGYFFIEENDLKVGDFSRSYFGVQR